MKNVTIEILAKNPNCRFFVESKEPRHDLKSLYKNEQEPVGLSRFFEQESFDLIQLSKEVDSDWIEFAMDSSLHTYYYTDIYLVKSPKPLIIRNSNDSLGQKDFGDLMNEHSYNMDAKKIHMLRKRGKLLTETALIEGNLSGLKKKLRHISMIYR